MSPSPSRCATAKGCPWRSWRREKTEEARAVYGTADTAHPGVFHLLHRTHPAYLGGRVWGIEPVLHYDHRALRHTPAHVRERFRTPGWRRVVAFQSRNPLHRAHVGLTLEAARACGANLLLHPAVGETQPGDVDRFTRIRCYERVLPYYAEGTAILSLLNPAMRMAAARGALARHRRQEPRPHPFHRRQQPRGTRSRPERPALLRAL